MALPLLAPLAWLLPLIKIFALGSIKFIGMGLGATIAPVMTANFLVSMSSGTPMKYATFRYEKGDFSEEQLATIESANKIITDSIENKERFLSRTEARRFLGQMLMGTAAGMRNSIVSIPSSMVKMTKKLLDFFSKS